MLKVSLITTVKNEAGSMERLLESLLAQSRKPEEVIIVDGGSTDGTVEVIRAYQGKLPLKLIVGEGFNISQGRNAAIAQAQGEIIASTDAGVRLDPDWLKHLLGPFEEDGSIDVVSGFFLPDPQSLFEVALGATVLPVLEDIGKGKILPGWLRRIFLFTDPDTFYPSSRSVAFKKEAWRKVGGYPEWLEHSEDLLFNMALKRAGFRFAFQPRAIIYFRPRRNIMEFFHQYFYYARGDGKAGVWPGEHLLRYGSYLLLAFSLFMAALFHHAIWLGGLLLGWAVYLAAPYMRLSRIFQAFNTKDKVKAILWVPIIRVTGDVAKMCGYPVGFIAGLMYRSKRLP